MNKTINKKRFIILNYTLFLFVLNIQGGIFAQERKDSARIYFHQGKTDIDLHLLDNGKELERFTRLCSVLDESACFIKKIQVVGTASPEGSMALNRRLSEKRADALMQYVSPYIKIPVLIKETLFSGSDWAGLLAMVRMDKNVPARAEVLRLLEDIVRIDKRGGYDKFVELKTLNEGESYAYLYKSHFPKLRSSMIEICYEPALPRTGTDTVYIHTRDTLYLRDTTIVTVPMQREPFHLAVKTNLAYDALLIPNIGIEFYLGNDWSMAGNWMYAWWKSDRRHRYWRIYGGDVEIRRWLGRRRRKHPLSGHHVGVYGQMATYDVELGGRGFLGNKWSVGGGISYGYSLPLSDRLNMDFTLGMGYFTGAYKEYLPMDNHYVWQKTRKLNWFGPTKAEVSLVWLIDRNREKGNRR